MFHVVDDQPDLCNILGKLVNSLGYKAKTFTCPQSYLDYARSAEFIMPIGTFTDINMPNMNGYELMQRVHLLHPSMKFIVVTGEPTISHAYKSNACMYLSKPYRIGTLSSIIKQLSDCFSNESLNNADCQQCDDREAFYLSHWSCPEDPAQEK